METKTKFCIKQKLKLHLKDIYTFHLLILILKQKSGHENKQNFSLDKNQSFMSKILLVYYSFVLIKRKLEIKILNVSSSKQKLIRLYYPVHTYSFIGRHTLELCGHDRCLAWRPWFCKHLCHLRRATYVSILILLADFKNDTKKRLV